MLEADSNIHQYYSSGTTFQEEFCASRPETHPPMIMMAMYSVSIYLNCDYEQMQSALPAVYSEEQNNLTTQYDRAATNYRAYYTSWCKEDSYEYHNESECNNANLCLLKALNFGKGEMERYKNCEMSESEREEYCVLLSMNNTVFANISACCLDTITCTEAENQVNRSELQERYGWSLDMTFLDINSTCFDAECATDEEDDDCSKVEERMAMVKECNKTFSITEPIDVEKLCSQMSGNLTWVHCLQKATSCCPDIIAKFKDGLDELFTSHPQILNTCPQVRNTTAAICVDDEWSAEDKGTQDIANDINSEEAEVANEDLGGNSIDINSEEAEVANEDLGGNSIDINSEEAEVANEDLGGNSVDINDARETQKGSSSQITGSVRIVVSFLLFACWFLQVNKYLLH